MAEEDTTTSRAGDGVLAAGGLATEAGQPGQAVTVSYRDSHTDPEAVAAYVKTCTQGYYAVLWKVTERNIVERCLRELVGRGARRYLDFVTGTGRVASVAEAVFPDCTAVDISTEMLAEAARRLRRTKLLCRDMTDEPWDAAFDVITAFRFFLNAEPDLRHAVLAALSGALQPGGYLLANVQENAAGWSGLARRAWRTLRPGRGGNVASLAELERLLAGHGLDVVDVRWYGMLPRPGPLFAAPYARLMRTVEPRIGQLPDAVRHRCQCFAVLARKPIARQSGGDC